MLGVLGGFQQEKAGTDSVPLDKSLLPGEYNEGSRPWFS